MRMFAWRWYVNTPDLVPARLDQLLNVRRDLANVALVKSILRDENVEPIEIRFFAELDQRCEIDVAVNDVFHARLRLADVVNATRDHEWLLDAVRSLNNHGVAKL